MADLSQTPRSAEHGHIEVVTRYECRVHASNRHAGYGTPVSVIAATRPEAVSKALDVGWSGFRGHGRVTIDKVTDEVVAIPAKVSTPPASTPEGGSR